MSKKKINSKLVILKLRKYGPFGGIILLTVVLMFFFKSNKSGFSEILNDSKEGIKNLYAENLQPLFTKTDLTNDDVFDFAVNQELPIDKKQNEFLKISELEDGDRSFEIKKSDLPKSDKSYNNFITALKLNESQKQHVDSILSSYKEDLYTSVLYNDKNIIAINPKIALLQEAIAQDLYVFSQNVLNASLTALPSSMEIEGVNLNFKDMIESTRDADEANMIFFTPDTIFNSECEIDNKKLRRDLAKHQWKMNDAHEPVSVKIKFDESDEVNKEIENAVNEAMKVQKEAVDAKVVIPQKVFANVMVREIPELAAEMAKLKNIKINFDGDKLRKLISASIASSISDSSNSADVFVNPEEFQKMFSGKSFDFSPEEIKKWEEFGMKMDSLSQKFYGNFSPEKFDFHNEKEIKEKKSNSKDSVKVK